MIRNFLVSLSYTGNNDGRNYLIKKMNPITNNRYDYNPAIDDFYRLKDQQYFDVLLNN